MEDFILYNEIGHGTRSTVYKGRKSGQLEYTAIQSYEKSFKALAEKKYVASKSINHANILKIFKWCETETENWIVMEYCPGGDLAALIAQDGALPEDAVRSFGSSIGAAILACHSKGIVLRDIRPEKILVDLGCLKLSASATCLQLENDTNEEFQFTDSMERFAAPELWTSENLLTTRHTRASDIWAFGCVLFELATGTPAFSGHSRQQLIQHCIHGSVLTAQAVLAGPSAVALGSLPQPLAEMLAMLLDVDAWRRPAWKVDEHFSAVFGTGPAAVAAANEADVTCDSLDNTVEEAAAMMENVLREADEEDAAAEQPFADEYRQLPTPKKSQPPNGHATFTTNPLAPSVGIAISEFPDEDDIPDESLTSSQDTVVQSAQRPFSHSLRSSVITVDRSAQQPFAPARAPNATMLVSHSASEAYQTPSIPPASAAVEAAAPSTADAQASRLPRPVGTRSRTSTVEPPRSAATEAPRPLTGTYNVTKSVLSLQPNAPAPAAVPAASAAHESKKQIQPTDFPPSPPSEPANPPTQLHSASFPPRAQDATPQRGRRTTYTVQQSPSTRHRAISAATPAATSSPKQQARATAEVPETPKIITVLRDFNSTFADIEVLLRERGAADLSPIANNSKIEKLEMPPIDTRSLSFSLPSPAELVNLPTQQLDELLSRIEKAAARTRNSALGYLCSVCEDPECANIIANSSLLLALSTALKAAPENTRDRFALVLSLLARHATMIDSSVPLGDVLASIADALRDQFRIVNMKRRLLPALGQAENGGAPELWRVSGATFTLVVRCLQKGEDDIVQHYAAKIIENVVALAPQNSKPFCVADSIKLLWGIVVQSKAQQLRRTASNALARILISEKQMVPCLTDLAGHTSIVAMMQDTNVNVRHAFVDILISILLAAKEVPRLVPSVAEFENLTTLLCRSVESVPEGIRSKIYLLLSIIFTLNYGCIVIACGSKLLHIAERDGDQLSPSGSDDFRLRCVGHLISSLVVAVPVITNQLQEALAAVEGRKHPSPAQARSLRPAVKHFTVVPSIISSAAIRPLLEWTDFLDAYSKVLATVPSLVEGTTSIESVFEGAGGEVLQGSLAILEALAQQPEVLTAQHEMVLNNILPSAVPLFGAGEGNCRMAAVHTFADIVERYAGVDPSTVDVTQALDHLGTLIAPFLSALLDDVPPLPYDACRLSCVILPMSASFASLLREELVFRQLFQNAEMTSFNDHTVLLLTAMVSTNCVTFEELAEVQVGLRLRDALTTMLNNENTPSTSIALMLALIHSVLRFVADSVKAVQESKRRVSRDSLTGSGPLPSSQPLLELVVPLSELFNWMVNLLLDEEVLWLCPGKANSIKAGEMASRCVYLLLQLFPKLREHLASDENLGMRNSPSVLTRADHCSSALANGSAVTQKFVIKAVQRVMGADAAVATRIRAHEGLRVAMSDALRDPAPTAASTTSTMSAIHDESL